MIRSQGTSNETPHSIQPPILENMVKKPLSFSTEDPDKIILAFEVYRRLSAQDKDVKVFGTATALLESLRQGLAPRHESITRHCTILIIQIGVMICIGSVTFSVLVITPLYAEKLLPKASLSFWKKKGSYPIVGHRGLGANSTTRAVLRIGENTFQSFLTAIDRGVFCVECDVPLTKDYRPIIYHDFLVKEIGGDISLYELSFDQFQHFSRSQAPKSDRFISGQQRYIERTHLDSSCCP